MSLRTVTIVSSFYIEPMSKPFSHLLNYIPNTENFQFIYNQIHQELISKSSCFNKNKDGLNIIIIRLCDLVDWNGCRYNDKILATNIHEFLSNIANIVKTLSYPLTVFVCPENADIQNIKSFQLSRNVFLKNLCSLSNVRVITEKEIADYYFVPVIHDDIAEKQGHIPYTTEYFAAISLMLARTLFMYMNKPYKVIVLDCDNTLWSGIIGEDRVNGIAITKERQCLQKFFIEQCNRGMLLCLCSKNNEKDVLTVFSNHLDMLLDIDKHIVSYRINWNPKSQNIISLAEELNLSLDSFIFIDDNPAECEEVRINVPEVLCVEIPKQEKDMIKFLKSIWLFDKYNINEDDQQRTVLYKEQHQRTLARGQDDTFSKFLENLQLKVSTCRISKKAIKRAAQLTARTNQFNLNPHSLTESTIRAYVECGTHCFITNAQDRFGSYGIVGVLIACINNSNLDVTTFLLSCRALNKGIEYQMLKFLVRFSKKHKLNEIVISYKKTDRNVPGQQFIKKIIDNGEVKNESGKVVLSVRRLMNTPLLPEEYSPIKKVTKRMNNNISISHRRSRIHEAIINDFGDVDALLNKLQECSVVQRKPEITLCSSNSIEKSIIDICLELNCIPLNTKSSFLEAGLDSLMAIRFVYCLYQRFGLEIDYSELMEKDASIASLALRVGKKNKNNTNAITPYVTDGSVISLSAYQRRLWIDEQIDSQQYTNNIALAIELNGDINMEVLSTVLQTLINRHSALRTKIIADENGVFQQIIEANHVNFTIHHIRDIVDIKQVKRYFSKFSRQPFVLNQAPLFRISLVHLAPKRKVLCICIHHIIHDSWSLSVFLNEMSEFYNAFVKNKQKKLEEITCQYDSFVTWHKEQMSISGNKSRTFWESYLSDFKEGGFMYDFQFQGEPSYDADRIYFELGLDTSQRLIDFSRKHKVTLYNLFMSIYGLLTYKYFGNNKDFLMTTPVSIRGNKSFFHTMGFFVNLIMLRFNLNGDNTLLSILNHVQIDFSMIRKHQFLPFEEIIKFLNIPRDINKKILLNFGLVYQGEDSFNINLKGIDSALLYPDKVGLLCDTSNHCRFAHLTLFLKCVNNKLYGVLEYNKSLFEKKNMQRFVKSFRLLAQTFISNPSQPIKMVSLLDSTDKNRLLELCEGPAVDYPNDWNIIDSFKESVRQYPDSIAIKDKLHSLTYKELDIKSDGLANYLLREFGLLHQRRIAIYMSRSANQIIAFIGVIKAACTYIPIDIGASVDWINNVLDMTQCTLALTDDATHNKINNKSVQDVCFNTIALADTRISSLPSRKSASENLAYITFTSGSTRKPKGVMIKNCSVVRLVKNNHYITVDSSDGVALLANSSFDASTFEIWGALLNGATLLPAEDAVLWNVNEFGAYLSREKITILWLTAELFHKYASLQPEMFSRLKYLITGGDIVNPNAIKDVMRCPSGRPTHIINAYGPSENTTFTTTYEIKQQKDNLPIPIGRPISGTNVYIISDDDTTQPILVPINVPGKLCVSGLGLMKGYLTQDGSISQPFIENIFSQQSCHQFLYDTGDYARWRDGGYIEYLGRKDSQVKIRGFRVDLHHIENLLLKHPDIKQAIALLKVTASSDKQLLLFYIAKSGNDLNVNELDSYFKQNVKPHFYIRKERFPITKNGKVDRKALAENFTHVHVSKTRDVRPLNQTEKAVARIYQQILSIPNVDLFTGSDFFKLGGDSLSVLKLLHILEKEFDVKLHFDIFFKNSTIGALAHVIQEFQQRNKKLYLHEGEQFLLKLSQGSHTMVPTSLVFIHPIGGAAYCYRPIIDCLELRYACYVIQDPDIRKEKLMFNTIEGMAKYYAALIQKTIPAGVCALCGYSFGGMLALEVARLLKGKMNVVFLFDTWIVSRMNASEKHDLKRLIMDKFNQFRMRLLGESEIESTPWLKLYYQRMQNLGFDFDPRELEMLDTRIVLIKAQKRITGFSGQDHSTNYVRPYAEENMMIYPIDADHDNILDKQYSAIISQYIVSEIESLLCKLQNIVNE